MSQADEIFINMCKDILENGYSSEGQIVRPKWADGTPAHTIKKFSVTNRYNLAEEFPILTLRPTPFKLAIEELLWIWQKKSNNIKDLNGHIWDEWADENGSIGKTYGYQMGIKHKYKEGEFDQVDRVLFDLKTNPYSRRIITNMYNHADLHEMNLAPCVYGTTWNVTGKKLNMDLFQRSNDLLAAGNFDVIQYAILIHMFAQINNLEVGELVHHITDAHIYDRHIPLVEELISKKSYPAPQLIINKDIKDFYQFTVDDFKLENYIKGLQVKNIPIAI